MKNTYIIVLALVILSLGAYYATTQKQVVERVTEPEIITKEPAPQGVEDGTTLEISEESEVSYIVQKEFLKKPTEKITGSTKSVSGTIAVSDDNVFTATATLDPATLESGSSGRDDYVTKALGQRITIFVPPTNLEDKTLESVMLPIELTINGITKTITFTVTGSTTQSAVNLSGTAMINMRDFNITPASAAGIYSVNEAAEITFAITAEA